MTQSISETRAAAMRVSKWLLDKGRPDESVALLAAWASVQNDQEGQELLAEALRIDPSSPLAQMTFERMEGIAGDHAYLDQAIQYYTAEIVAQLEAEMRRPTFRRAQMGFNNNVKYQGAVYHVQTEDSGLDAPHIITHLFADGGRVIKSYKRFYTESVDRPDVAVFVRELMKGQHMEMVLHLREGRFDAVIAGEAVGGMETLSEPPNIDIRKLASKKKERAEAAKAAAGEQTSTAPMPATDARPAEPAQTGTHHFSLVVLRSLTGGPERYDPVGEHVTVGGSGAIGLPGERFCHPREADLEVRDGRLWLLDREGGNGVFLRIRTPVELEFGDEFIVGDQLIRVEKNPVPDDGPDPDPTYFYSSPKWPSSFRVVQVFEGGAPGSCIVARGNTLQIGSVIGDLICSYDPLVDQQHCIIEEQAGTVVLTDLASRTGVFVRIRGEQELVHGDELLIGRTRLVVDLTPSRH